MMDCRDAHSRLHLYVDGELPPADLFDLEAHLVECRSCSAEYEALRAVVDTVRGARPLYDVPHGAAERSKTMVESHVRRARLRRLVPAAAAALILAVSVFVAMRFQARFRPRCARIPRRRNPSPLYPRALASRHPNLRCSSPRWLALPASAVPPLSARPPRRARSNQTLYARGG